MKNNFGKVILLLIFLFVTVFFTGCGKENKKDVAPETDIMSDISARGVIKVGVLKDSKPFGYYNEDNELVGFDVELSKMIVRKVFGNSVRIEFEQVTVPSRIHDVNAGKVDMVAALMSVTPQRTIIVQFSEPYLSVAQGVVVPVNSDINNVKKLNRRRIIVILSSTSEKVLKYFAPAAVVLGYKTHEEAYNALLTGFGEALVDDDTVLKDFVVDNPNFKLLNVKLNKENYAIGFKNSNSAINLKNAVNEAIKELSVDGSLAQLKQKYHFD